MLSAPSVSHRCPWHRRRSQRRARASRRQISSRPVRPVSRHRCRAARCPPSIPNDQHVDVPDTDACRHSGVLNSPIRAIPRSLMSRCPRLRLARERRPVLRRHLPVGGASRQLVHGGTPTRLRHAAVNTGRLVYGGYVLAPLRRIWSGSMSAITDRHTPGYSRYRQGSSRSPPRQRPAALGHSERPMRWPS